MKLVHLDFLVNQGHLEDLESLVQKVSRDLEEEEVKKVTEEKWESLVERVSREKRERLDPKDLQAWLDQKGSLDLLDPWV